MIDLGNFFVFRVFGKVKGIGTEYILQDLLCFFGILLFQQRYHGLRHTSGYKEQFQFVH